MADEPETPETPLPTPPPEPIKTHDRTGWTLIDEAHSWECPDCKAKTNLERPWGVTVTGPGLPIERRCDNCGRWLGHEPPA